MTPKCRAALCAAALLLPLLAACNRVTAENYDKLKSGQTYEEVKGFLGEPTRCDELVGLRSCRWGDDKSNITVNFVSGKAVLFSAENIR
jgi:hypothetical protein